MGGDMRGFGGHVGAAAVLVSLRQSCRPGKGEKILVAKMRDGDVGDRGEGRTGRH